MPAKKSKTFDYKTLDSSAKNGGANSGDQASLLKPSPGGKVEDSQNSDITFKGLNNSNEEAKEIEVPPPPPPPFPAKVEETSREEIFIAGKNDKSHQENIAYAEQRKRKKEEKKAQKDKKLLSTDRWLARNGHTLTYVGLYLFSVMVFFRPYELFSPLSFLSETALYFALATLIIYIPTQFSTEGSLTTLSTEVKCILVLAFLALVTIPIAKDPPTAWATFNDPFIKAVLMFIVMVNVLRTRRRLMGLMWLSLSVGLYLSYMALYLYSMGELRVEGYRVEAAVKGLFSNPNDLALHLVTMTPLAICLALASRNKIMRWFYFLMAAFFVGANTVTFSRGGFLGLVAASGVLAWKLARKQRLNVSIAAVVFGGLFVLLAPGNYGLRLLSIFVPELDPVGSHDARRELLMRSILVTLRNPWGIGIGNFTIVGFRNLVTHNAYTQISSELGVLGLAAYLIFMISPLRKLGAIERTLYAKDEYNWFYYLSIGLQASIVGYMVSSFFVSVAYNWFIYYLIAYAVAFRRIYQIENNLREEVKPAPLWEWKTA
jgi:putative inorganic carbon (hco3(-)) transporter